MSIMLSKGRCEASSIDIMDWMIFLKKKITRINGDDLEKKTTYSIKLSNEVCCFKSQELFIDFNLLHLVWFRRWHDYTHFTRVELLDYPNLAQKVNTHIRAEFKALSNNFYALFEGKWLSNPTKVSVNKLEVMKSTAKVGLKIPDTLITNNKSDLVNFKLKNGRIITKSIGEITQFDFHGETLHLYTSEVQQEDIVKLPERFFPSLFQKLLLKEYELRIFYLNKSCYSMAMFSQANPKTQIDFRLYDNEKPNRWVPYQLPQEIEEKLRKLMELLDLTTGSIDMIKTTSKEYVFLEINPIGQFGMVSYPCNYFLEKKIAQYLIDSEYEKSKY